DMTSIFSVKGLVAAVTGGGTGIGREVSHALVAAGASKVYILGRRGVELDHCKTTSSKPSAIIPIICDVTSRNSLDAATAQIRSEAGYINLLFANAGINDIPKAVMDPSSVQSLQEGLQTIVDVDMYAEVYRINTLGTLETIIAFLALLDEGNRRNILFQTSQVLITSSITGTAKATYGNFGYAASKAAIGLLAKQLSGILMPHHIRINVLVAGIYGQGMTAGMLQMLTRDDPTKKGSIQRKYIPAERAGSVIDLTGTVLFLASRAGGYISGAEIVSDGGLLAVPPSWAVPTPLSEFFGDIS
ncbi:hypothetical protein COCHEDRAFT_1098439, partial [Bipolaris maydis C5]